MKHGFGRFLVLAALVGWGTDSAADVGQETLAETLYQSAVQLIRNGDYATACPKLAESHKADPAGGTVLLLAICYEKVGKTASAWIKFKEALAMARADRRADREQRAREHLTALEPRLSRMTVVMPDSVRALPGFTVSVDGTVVPTSSQSWTMPVDPGQHHVEAEATGMQPWSGELTIPPEDAQKESIEIPMLDGLPEKPSEPSPQPEPGPTRRSVLATHPPEPDTHPVRVGRTQRTVGVIVGGAGLSAAGVGSYFGIQALLKNRDARDLCPESPCSDPKGTALSGDAMDHGTRANVLFAVGGAVLTTGVVLYVTAPKKKKQASWNLVPVTGGALVGVSQRF